MNIGRRLFFGALLLCVFESAYADNTAEEIKALEDASACLRGISSLSRKEQIECFNGVVDIQTEFCVNDVTYGAYGLVVTELLRSTLYVHNEVGDVYHAIRSRVRAKSFSDLEVTGAVWTWRFDEARNEKVATYIDLAGEFLNRTKPFIREQSEMLCREYHDRRRLQSRLTFSLLSTAYAEDSDDEKSEDEWKEEAIREAAKYGLKKAARAVSVILGRVITSVLDATPTVSDEQETKFLAEAKRRIEMERRQREGLAQSAEIIRREMLPYESVPGDHGMASQGRDGPSTGGGGISAGGSSGGGSSSSGGDGGGGAVIRFTDDEGRETVESWRD